MFSQVFYTPNSLTGQKSTYNPTKSPLFQIFIAKIIIVILIYLLPDIIPQYQGSLIITVSAAIQFWVTKNMGRRYLKASWSVDTSGQQDVWIYEANFKSPSSFEQIFWYSQIIYGIFVLIGCILIISTKKYSLACATITVFMSNYVNFHLFGKIITLRNTGILNKLADQAQAHGQIRQNITIPISYSKYTKAVPKYKYVQTKIENQ